MSTLTRRQKETLDYVKKYIKKHGIAPSLDEVKGYFKLSAKSSAHEQLAVLVEKGYLKKSDYAERGYELIKEEKNLISVPLSGIIAAGQPIEAIETINETVKITNTARFSRNVLYALRVRGDSMIGDGIFDNDIVIVKKQSAADNGDTVVAIIDNNEATLKRFYQEPDKIRLQPANPSLKPIYREEVEIRGVVVSIIRNLFT
ncbi:MAG: transcriptional repressor LexA [Candidatus Falkowbacteria bacterium]